MARERSGPRSLSRTVFADLRAEILAGRYEPGAKLSPRVTATKSNVSLSVAREALTRLAEQGLVVAEPQLGFSVVTLDLDDVRDISTVRILIEGGALRDAIGNSDVEYEARVVSSHHRLSRTPSHEVGDVRVTTDEWAAAHAQFHSDLLSASTSPRLRDLAANLRETAELYRRWAGTFVPESTSRDVPDEHHALMQAVLDRDKERAVELLTDHIKKTTDLLALYVESAQVTSASDEGDSDAVG